MALPKIIVWWQMVPSTFIKTVKLKIIFKLNKVNTSMSVVRDTLTLVTGHRHEINSETCSRTINLGAAT